MEAILKIPYSYSDPNHDFDHSQEFAFDGSDECMQQWEKMKQEYETKMVNTYKKYKQVIDRNIHRLGQNIAINNEGEKENNHFQQTRTYITETIAKIHDMYNQPISIDTLIDYYKNGEIFILDIQLPVYEHNDILETEVKTSFKFEKCSITNHIVTASNLLIPNSVPALNSGKFAHTAGNNNFD